ncbi:MAG: substrate-binding protein [Candidatus Omnitrophica bacterium]|nr:substrate-binding protein [Candidatus Omnitrophota bacterium]
MNKWMVACAGIGALLMVNAAGAKAQDQKETVLFGFNVPLSGSYSDQGEDQLRACKLAVDELNAAGGVLGKTIVYSVKDTQTNPKTAAQNAEALYGQEGAVMVTGGSSSAEAVAVGTVAAQQKKVFMVGLSHSNATTGFEIDAATGARTEQKVNRYMFRWYNNAWMSAQAASTYLLEKFGKTAKYYYITADYTWGHSVERSFRDVLEAAGCQTVGTARTPLGEKSFVPSLLKAKMANPDVLMLVQFGRDMITSIAQSESLGVKSSMKIVVPLIELRMAQGVGPSAMEGIIGTTPWYWGLEDKYAGSKNFVEKFKQRYGMPPGDAAASVWVAIHEYVDAVKRTGTFDAQPVVKALEGHKFTVLKDEEYWRDWDHQAMTSTLLVEGKAKAAMKDEFDLLRVISEVPGEKVAITKADSPVVWSAEEKF